MSRRRPHVTGTIIGVFLSAVSGAAVAQTPAGQPPRSPRWEVEGHGGLHAATNPTLGRVTPTPAAESFSFPPSFSSQRVSSWLFYDGAALFNAVRLNVSSRPPAIVPLNGVLARAGTHQPAGAMIGARVARRLTERAAAEFSIDITRGVALTTATLDAIEASRAS